MPSLKYLAAVLCFSALSPLAQASNLIVNGDFEAGMSGFGTDYFPSANGCISCAGVSTNTLTWYYAPGYVEVFNDHTSGAGMMLLYDPPNTPSAWRIWYQNVNVEAGKTYTFSGWGREANSENLGYNDGLIRFEVNGDVLGTLVTVQNAWTAFSAQYTALATGSVTLALRDMNGTTWNGTYTAIDDLAFTQAVPEPETFALMLAGLGLVGFAVRRRQA
ncbi:MAG: PEPxxWA-CTERM sorting domain-containing protein [Pseudomonadota bacterium]